MRYIFNEQELIEAEQEEALLIASDERQKELDELKANPKAILISIQPQWVEKILSGEKTIEIRKTKPNCKLPIKGYIYCTNSAKCNLYIPSEFFIFQQDDFSKPYFAKEPLLEDVDNLANGRVVAEFTLNNIKKFDYEGLKFYGTKEDLLSRSCLTDEQLCNYIQDTLSYAWHIEELKIYDKPKELSEFKHWIHNADYDGWNEQRTKIEKGYVLKPITRPPLSWCYVRPINE